MSKYKIKGLLAIIVLVSLEIQVDSKIIDCSDLISNSTVHKYSSVFTNYQMHEHSFIAW
jgi:hypothetical protein